MAGRDTHLAARWPLPESPALRDELLAAYASPGRGYHDRRHLEEVLDRLDELAAAGARFDGTEVALAAWFHDAVYEGRGGDEERSAEWAGRALVAAGVGPATVAEVVRLVRLTERHDPAPDDGPGAALCDADLAVLASPEQRYAEYAAGVRAEHAHLDDESFDAGRAAFLRGLLGRRPLFATAHGRRAWEPLARRNVAAELSRLS